MFEGGLLEANKEALSKAFKTSTNLKDLFSIELRVSEANKTLKKTLLELVQAGISSGNAQTKSKAVTGSKT